MAKSYYTVLVVPDRSSATHKFRVQQGLFTRLGVLATILVAAGVGAAVHYTRVVTQVTDDRILKEENQQLRAELEQVREKVYQLGRTVERVEKLQQALEDRIDVVRAQNPPGVGFTDSGHYLNQSGLAATISTDYSYPFTLRNSERYVQE